MGDVIAFVRPLYNVYASAVKEHSGAAPLVLQPIQRLNYAEETTDYDYYCSRPYYLMLITLGHGYPEAS